MGVYQSDNFSGRVSYAATVICCRGTCTRHFDTCFEMWDGDAVAVALYRRSRKNLKLRRNLWKYISRASVLPIVWENRRRKNLAAWAAEIRAERQRQRAA